MSEGGRPVELWARMLDTMPVCDREIILQAARDVEIAVKIRRPNERFGLNAGLETLAAVGRLLSRYPEEEVKQLGGQASRSDSGIM